LKKKQIERLVWNFAVPCVETKREKEKKRTKKSHFKLEVRNAPPVDVEGSWLPRPIQPHQESSSLISVSFCMCSVKAAKCTRSWCVLCTRQPFVFLYLFYIYRKINMSLIQHKYIKKSEKTENPRMIGHQFLLFKNNNIILLCLPD